MTHRAVAMVWLALMPALAACRRADEGAHAAALPLVEDKAPAGADVTLLRGWFKAAVTPKARMLRLRLPSATVEIANGVVVVHGDSTLV